MNATIALWRRDVLRTVRNRAVMISAVTIPSLFVAAFYAIFSLPAKELGFDYATFILPSGLLQAGIFTAGGSALAIARDAEGGVHDRIRAMPIPTTSIAAGRLLADVTRFVWSGAIACAVAIALGARPSGPLHLLAAFVLLGVLTAVLSAAVDAVVLRSKRPISSAMVFQGVTISLLMFSTAFVPAVALTGAVGKVVIDMPFSPVLDTARDLLVGAPLERGLEAFGWLAAFGILGVGGLATCLRRHSD